MLIHRDLEKLIGAAIKRAQQNGDLPQFEIPDIIVERPRDPSHGDFATAIALQLARVAKMAPLKIADAIKNNFELPSYLSGASVIPPGFFNFQLSEAWLQQEVNRILEQGNEYGRFDLGQGQKAQVEYVSANPTGPITFHRTRGGVMGDTLSRALKAAGYDVTREYYYNDAGRQVTILGESVRLRYMQLLGQAVEFSDEHYQGGYIIELSGELMAEHGSGLLDAPLSFFSDYAVERISKDQKESLKRINIEFDSYFREQSLYESGRVWETLDQLRENGYVYDKEDAQWFRSTDFGDDQDRVLVKASGEPTYRLPDIAYHWDKYLRGFDLVADIFGPDHHATAPQVLMGLQGLGIDPSFVHTIIHQIVTLIREGKQEKMSTRLGVFVTLDELVDEVGADPIRYFMISRSGNSQIDFDMDLAMEQSDKNPVYYIQNAHVRCAGILRKWQAEGYDLNADKNADLSLLTEEKELAFLLKATELSEVLEKIAMTLEPHTITFYAYELASLFHPTYEESRVLHPDVPEPLRLARLRFYKAAKQLFARVLDLMGMSAPDVM
jgi:arginyl-tRNA synthetase